MSSKFLDALPEEATSTIPRFFSARPDSKIWRSFVSVRDALQLCNDKSVISAASCDVFNVISTRQWGRNTLDISKANKQMWETMLHAAGHPIETLEAFNCPSACADAGHFCRMKPEYYALFTSLKELRVCFEPFVDPSANSGIAEFIKGIPC